MKWTLLFAGLVVAGSACGTSDTQPSGAAGSGGGGSEVLGGPCTGDEPQTPAGEYCVTDCRDDFLRDPNCIDGRWQCESPTFRRASFCSPEELKCAGLRAPADECDEAGWYCAPTEADFTDCPSVLCATCERFDSTVEQQGCRCSCGADGYHVACERVATN